MTGAARGIGRAIALELAAAGADVLVHTRARRGDAEEVAGAVRGLGRASEVELCDLAELPAAMEFAERAWNWRNGVDIWVNNAGADVLTGDAADWSFNEKLTQLWMVDVRATICLAREIGRRMKGRNGGADSSILNLGWDQAASGMGGDSGEMFSAAKGAVAAFTKSLAHSLAPAVRVNCLAPGWIRTAWGEEAPPYWQRRARDESLLGRWGTPQDVARVARFLASPAAQFVNGQLIVVNGGFRRSDA